MMYSINIEPLFPGVDFYEKIKRIKDSGFENIEFWGWCDKDITKIKSTCKKYGVKISAFCGQQDYSLCDRENSGNYLDWIRKSIETAKFLECDTLIIHSNHFTQNGSSDFRKKYSTTAMIASIVNTLTLLAPIAEQSGIKILVEPLNNLGADAGMVLNDTKTAADIIRAVNSPNINVLCDIFHMQVMHGNLLRNILENMDIIPYIHIADAPDRHEPGTGEINHTYLLNTLIKNGFDGVVCFELFPKDDTYAAFKAIDQVMDNIKE